MAQAKQKTVFTAEPDQLKEIQAMVQSGRYASTSAFLREAIDEKLELLRRERLRSQLARYCDSGYAAEDVGLVAEQALDPDESA